MYQDVSIRAKTANISLLPPTNCKNFYLFLVKSQNPVKRGRGRPRKDSLASNMSHTQAYFLDEGKPLIAD